jgi:hypothetical protein
VKGSRERCGSVCADSFIMLENATGTTTSKRRLGAQSLITRPHMVETGRKCVQMKDPNSKNTKDSVLDGEAGVDRAVLRMRPEVSIWSDAIEMMGSAI